MVDILGKCRAILVWDKKCRNDWEDNFSDCEVAYTSFDGPARVYRHLWVGALRQSESGAGERIHPTQKPIALFSWIIERFTKRGDLVFDPFSGSGTTAIACWHTGRRFVCVERDIQYHALSVERLSNAQQQGNLFEPPPENIEETENSAQHGQPNIAEVQIGMDLL
jgi:DNA modification methylase